MPDQSDQQQGSQTAQISGTVQIKQNDGDRRGQPAPHDLSESVYRAVHTLSGSSKMAEARHGIRVHSLTPSIVTGTISHDRMMADPFSRKLFEKAKARAALGVPTPEDVAALAVFLAGPAAARLTGQSITVNGGLAVA